MSKYTPVIGFETHVELKTKTKMFCGCKNDPFGAETPNSLTCPVCLGLPGALPVPQKKAIDWTIMIGLALNCQITTESKFDRKHYFYPDLPKGYQISQYDKPLCVNGYVETSFGRVGITRVHLEEDTGKLIHRNLSGKEVSLVDFNRSGVPLVEIVTEPDITSSAQAKEYARNVRNIIRNLGLSDCDMEKGTMRLEANISLGLDLGYKVEVKNVNSFRYTGMAIDYELKRQKEMLEKGETPIQETRGWNESKNRTMSQRVKEEAADYRYFPEPDIPPIVVTKQDVEKIKAQIPTLPEERKSSWMVAGMREDYAGLLSSEKSVAEYTQKAIDEATSKSVDINKVAGMIANKQVDISKNKPEDAVNKILSQASNKISDSSQLESWVDQTILEMPKVAEDYKEGKDQAIGSLIGKVMGLSKGQADGAALKSMFETKLRGK